MGIYKSNKFQTDGRIFKSVPKYFFPKTLLEMNLHAISSFKKSTSFKNTHQNFLDSFRFLVL